MSLPFAAAALRTRQVAFGLCSNATPGTAATLKSGLIPSVVPPDGWIV